MRLFLAIDLPDELRRELAAVRRDLEEKLRGWRWVRADGIHLTLRFLGEVSEATDARARPLWRRAAASCGRVGFRLEKLGCFPPRGAPRVLWIGARDLSPGNDLVSLAAAVELAAREVGHAPEKRPFRPHLTLARAARGARPDRPPESFVGTLGEAWVDRVVLFRSTLSPGGARYESLETFPLGSGPAEG